VRVIVIGGGVGGMSAAHELVERGFEVAVYEQRAIAGGKARSVDAIAGSGGRRALPGEHGFRFFPGFYWHLPDTMRRIPYPGRLNGVLDNLVTSTQIQIAREDGKNELVGPAQFPVTVSDWQATIRFGLDLAAHVGIPIEDQVHFVGLLSDLLSACEARRFEQYENQSWWDFADAEHRSAEFRKFLADGLTRSLVAARGREMSARTGGYILLQLLQDLGTPGGQADRVLCGPTNDVWIDPWLRDLDRRGVVYRFGCRVDAIASSGDRVTGISGQRVDAAGVPVGSAFDDSADYYVAAVPVEVMRERIAMDALKRVSPRLARLDELTVRWMNGIMFYLRRDVPLIHGHSIYIDSSWALTSISQRQFWPQFDLHGMGDGEVDGILSVDISDWESPGRFAARGKIAKQCANDEVAAEVWDQLKASLNDGGETLSEANRAAWFLDPDVVEPNPIEATNLEPLLVNTAGSWPHRPPAELPEVENLFLASDYVQTNTDLATMEAANDAARRAVNGILRASGSDAEPCAVHDLREPGGVPFAIARELDRLVFKIFGPDRGPPPTVALQDGTLEINPIAGARRLLRHESVR
jgi:uncharacterized protein with NAD-binding domain and iron-sulfur cluster